MCQDSRPEDLSHSRIRWYDLPALLFLHWPVRCRLCNERYYTLRGRRKLASVLPRLWMHYAILIALICVGVGIYQNSEETSFAEEGTPTRATLQQVSLNRHR